MHELIIDSFAGGGGASLGITWALGRHPDVAINHDATAILMHKANHPTTRHYTEDVWKLSPRELASGQGFPESYVLTGSNTSQVARIGNSVCPQAAEALAQYSQHGRCQMIFQMDGVNDKRLMKLRGYGLDLVPLFDQSGGAGIVPLEWPRPLEGMYCGYAGGMGPDTLERQLPRLALAVGDRTIWIDMERRVRSDDDQRFELEKVRACLEMVEPYVW